MIDFDSFLIQEACFTTSKSFDEVVSFIKYVSKEEDYPLNNDILVIEIPEGVFLKSRNKEWNDYLESHSVANTGSFELQKFSNKDWDNLTRKYRAPIQSFGDEKLAVWRIGF